ncbi:TraR/DksA C4-type zinc finger protein [Thiocystis violacea]|uniref:TraR/DksA C4-type zinc finger protein n=1 Tax=Thiocystis violacea TaxID=13725 RepID=UPI0019036442|nr:hypothetical protein [Thiocystis violacea]
MPEKRYCVHCGKIVPKQRISANPSATRCVKCQAFFEKNHDVKKKIADIQPHGKEVTKGRLKEPPFAVCPHCGITIRRLSLKKHIRNMHPNHARPGTDADPKAE